MISLKFVSATPLVLEIEQTTAAGSGGRAWRGVRGKTEFLNVLWNAAIAADGVLRSIQLTVQPQKDGLRWAVFESDARLLVLYIRPFALLLCFMQLAAEPGDLRAEGLRRTAVFGALPRFRAAVLRLVLIGLPLARERLLIAFPKGQDKAS